MTDKEIKLEESRQRLKASLDKLSPETRLAFNQAVKDMKKRYT